jgi:hypothetical protein
MIMAKRHLRSVALLGASLVVFSASLVVAQSSGPASVLQRFAGTWKEDVSKRKLGAGVPLRFQRDAKGGLEEVRGPEARPISQPVIFDGKPHEVEQGITTSWKQVDPNTFERVLSDGAGVVSTRRISVAADGKTLTEATERKSSDGQTFVATIIYQRSSGDAQGLVGRWTPVSVKMDTPRLVRYELVGANGLKMSDNAADVTFTVTLDGKPAPVVGRSVLPGTTSAAKVVDEHTIAFTQSREGVVAGKSVRTVSADGRTLTVTNTTVGPNAGEPSVVVFMKQ